MGCVSVKDGNEGSIQKIPGGLTAIKKTIEKQKEDEKNDTEAKNNPVKQETAIAVVGHNLNQDASVEKDKNPNNLASESAAGDIFRSGTLADFGEMIDDQVAQADQFRFNQSVVPGAMNQEVHEAERDVHRRTYKDK